MMPSQIFDVLKARWRSAAIVFFGIVTAVVAASLLLPRQYTATASVLLDAKSPDPIAGIVLPGMTLSGYMATQVDVIQSERVALRALDMLKLDQSKLQQERWREATQSRGDFRSWLAEMVATKLDIRPGKDSDVLTVRYTSPDPQFSADVANAIVKAYIDTTLELRVEPAKQYNNFFDDRAKHLRDDLETAQAKLSAYQRSKGIIATDERLDVENARLTELSTQLVALQGVAEESKTRQGQLGANGDRMSEVLNNPLITNLATELARQEARLREAESRLGEANPQVQELQANIAELKSKIESETRRINGSVTVNNSVNQTRVGELRRALEDQRAKVLRLKGQRDEAAVLQRDVENAQRAYDAMFARVSQSHVESQLTQTNVSVLKYATPPPFPSSPKLLLNSIVAVVLGLVLAAVTVLVRERLDRRVRSADDVQQLLAQPFLGVLPAPSRAAAAGRLRKRLTQAAGSTTGVGGGVGASSRAMAGLTSAA